MPASTVNWTPGMLRRAAKPSYNCGGRGRSRKARIRNKALYYWRQRVLAHMEPMPRELD